MKHFTVPNEVTANYATQFSLEPVYQARLRFSIHQLCQSKRETGSAMNIAIVGSENSLEVAASYAVGPKIYIK